MTCTAYRFSLHTVDGCIIMKGAALVAIPTCLNDGRVKGCGGENSVVNEKRNCGQRKKDRKKKSLT